MAGPLLLLEELEDASGLVGEGIDRAWAAGEDEVCARALARRAAARAAWLAFDGELPPLAAFFGGMSLYGSSRLFNKVESGCVRGVKSVRSKHATCVEAFG